MAIQVKNLVLARQSGTDNTYYASWEAPVSTVTTTTSTSSSGSIKKGSLVSIKSGATWYNGAPMPDWVKKRRWYVYQISGSRVVIHRDEDKTHAIMSPVNKKYLTAVSTSSSGSSSTTTTTETKVSNVDHYKVVWKYATDDGVWFTGSSGTVATDEEKSSTYSPPENASQIGVWVTPVAKNKPNTDKPYWTGTATSKTIYMDNEAPAEPGGLTVELDKFTLTATVDNIEDVRTDEIEFSVVKNDVPFTSGIVTVLLQRAIFTCQVDADGEYRVRCRAINTTGGKSYSTWTTYAGPYKTIPPSVTNVQCAADSKTSLKVTWDALSTAAGYTVQYTTRKEYFDSSANITSASVESNTAYLTGLETGVTWYVRVRASNDAGDSGWSEVVSAILGTKPEPPTTWSLSNTAYVGEDIILYWTHNSEDESKQTEAQIRIEVNGTAEYITVASNVSADEDEPIYSYTLSSDDYQDGGYIKWMVKTKGVADEYSDWSTQRTVDIYAPPTVVITPTSLDEGGVLTSMPLVFNTVAGPLNQSPISYHISIVSNGAYETVDNVGNPITITDGDEIYSKVVVSPEKEVAWTISAGDVTFESGQTYILKVSVAMDSGLIATNTIPFSVSWDTVDYISDASISIDPDTLAAYIAPFCLGEDDVLIENVQLAVYRREADGTFTEIATGLENTMVTTVTDPHPSLDFARYRIVTTDMTTGKVDYSDLPGIEVGESAIVLQWDEQWQNFDYDDEDIPDVQLRTGSMVRLPYNVDVSESRNPDVSLIEYIGRRNPVSYYGTQQGESGSWSTVIDKNDRETLHALRRLSAWNGDVYVREPSGIGYWAQVKIGMSIKYSDLTIPVNIDVTRVEGGI